MDKFDIDEDSGVDVLGIVDDANVVGELDPVELGLGNALGCNSELGIESELEEVEPIDDADSVDNADPVKDT